MSLNMQEIMARKPEMFGLGVAVAAALVLGILFNLVPEAPPPDAAKPGQVTRMVLGPETLVSIHVAEESPSGAVLLEYNLTERGEQMMYDATSRNLRGTLEVVIGDTVVASAVIDDVAFARRGQVAVQAENRRAADALLALMAEKEK